MTKFADRLREARKEKGFTQERMAKQMNIHRTTYTKYESGLVQPDLDGFYQIVKILEVNPMDLLE